jgi:hypothetical protein
MNLSWESEVTEDGSTCYSPWELHLELHGQGAKHVGVLGIRQAFEQIVDGCAGKRDGAVFHLQDATIQQCQILAKDNTAVLRPWKHTESEQGMHAHL